MNKEEKGGKMNRRLMIALSFLVLLSLRPDAQARDFKVYGYSTPKAGELEFAYWLDDFIQSEKNDNLLRHTFEAEYGVTDRWTIAAYLDFEDPKDTGLKYVQFRSVFLRYRLFNPGERFFDPAIYLEYYIPRQGERSEEHLETRLIFQKRIGEVDLRLNPIFDKKLTCPAVDPCEEIEGMEFEYGASGYVEVSRKVEVGVEIYGDMGEIGNFKSPEAQRHYLFPSFNAQIRAITVNAGIGFGLTKASDDLIFKAIFAWEL